MTLTKAWIGVDPGASGAAALITADGEVLVMDWPGSVLLAVGTVRTWRMEHQIELAALESVHAMPKQGVSSMFKLGSNFGQWQGLLAALGVPFVLVRPQEWQKGVLHKCDGPDTKSQSLEAARRQWPDVDLSLKKHHGRADALHLAAYARRVK
ncbi:RuvC family protein [Desulfonatronum thiodismutans]|uniref:hypothetical protein n=1 Tax=Desulfonatronum thiodismutans TaxID=159290 RepID=UPI0004DB87BD|nr:hypothetical protein [Desulfonatronum thiodismutans]